jgi:hypothetical protein
MPRRQARRHAARRWSIAGIVIAALGVSAVAFAAPSTIVGGATASQPAQRLTPPGPHLGGCPMFPASNAWNQEIASAPLHPRSAEIISHIQATGAKALHPDFGENLTYGIPFVVVPVSQPLVPITYTAYGNESDPGPFPIPPNAPVEGGGGGGDRHVLVVQEGSCQLYELFVGRPDGQGGWLADSGAKFDLTTGALRPLGWTSADAAGLPILPGLVRYDEVASGVINHAIRATFSETQSGFVLPATHFASDDPDPTLPAMGMRLRLRADYNISGLTGQARVIAAAMQRYGLIVADNGGNWFFQGAPNAGWNDDDLNQLKAVPGTAFEVVNTGPVQTG